MAASQNAQNAQKQEKQEKKTPVSAPQEKKTAAADQKKEKATPSTPPPPTPAPSTPSPAPQKEKKEDEEHHSPASSPQTEQTTENPLTEFAATLKTMTVQFKALQTAYTRMEKELQKKQNQSNQKKQNRGDSSKKGVTPPGFMKPVKLSKELAHMLGKPEGSTMPRNEVNNAIHVYIRDNNLQKEDDRRDIVPDAKLMALFKPGTYNPDEVDPKTGKKKKLTHFVLQGLIKHHFIKLDDESSSAEGK